MSKLQKLVAATAIVSTVGVGLSQIADADTYTVKKGDTLWDIAINNGTTVDTIAVAATNFCNLLIYSNLLKINFESSDSFSTKFYLNFYFLISNVYV